MDTTVLLEHLDWVRALAYKLVKDHNVADDLVQEAWLAAERSRPIDPAAAKGWFASVLRRKASERYRKNRNRKDREGRVARAEEVPSDERLHDQVDTEQMLVAEIMELEEPYRRTLLLRYFDDQTPAEIASMDGIPARTVKSRLTRAHAALRERLDRRHGGQRRDWMLALIPIARAPQRLKAASAVSSAGSLAAVAATLAIVGGGVWMATDTPEVQPAELVDMTPRALPADEIPAVDVAVATPPKEAREALGVKAVAAVAKPKYDRPVTLEIQAVEDATDQPVAGVSGYIIDFDQVGEDISPLSGASFLSVKRHGRKFVTDAAGRASMASSGLGTEGMIMTDRWMGSFSAEGKPNEPITVRLHPNATMQVRVTDIQGEPMANVPVAFGIDDQRVKTSLAGTTDPSGLLKIPFAGEYMRMKAAAEGDVDLVAAVSIPGLDSPLVPVMLDQEGRLPREPVELVCPPLGEVQLDASAISPRSNVVAVQTFVDSQRENLGRRPERQVLRLDGHESASTRCGLGGQLEAVWLEDGKLKRMRFVGPGTSARPRKVLLMPDLLTEDVTGPEPENKLAPNRVRVTGRLLFPNAEPATSVETSVQLGNRTKHGRTDELGRFEFERTAMDEADFPAKIDFALPGDASMMDGAYEISALPAGSTVDIGDVFLSVSPFLAGGTVVDSTGEPVPGATLFVSVEVEYSGTRGEDPSLSWESDTMLDVQCGEEGQFAIYAPDPRMWILSSSAPTGRFQLYAKTNRSSSAPVICSRGEQVSLVMQQSAVVDVTVIGLDAGLRKNAQVVFVQQSSGKRFGSFRRADSFQSEKLLPGTYTVEVGHSHFEAPLVTIENVEVRSGGEPDPRLFNVDVSTLVKSHRVTVLAYDGRPAEGVTVWVRGEEFGASGLKTDKNGVVTIAARPGVPREVQLNHADFEGESYEVAADITLKLERPIAMSVRLVGWEPGRHRAPRLVLRGTGAGASLFRMFKPTSGPDENGLITFELDRFGEYRYSWGVRDASLDWRKTATSEDSSNILEVEAEGSRIELTVPPEVLEHLDKR